MKPTFVTSTIVVLLACCSSGAEESGEPSPPDGGQPAAASAPEPETAAAQDSAEASGELVVVPGWDQQDTLTGAWFGLYQADSGSLELRAVDLVMEEVPRCFGSALNYGARRSRGDARDPLLLLGEAHDVSHWSAGPIASWGSVALPPDSSVDVTTDSASFRLSARMADVEVYELQVADLSSGATQLILLETDTRDPWSDPVPDGPTVRITALDLDRDGRLDLQLRYAYTLVVPRYCANENVFCTEGRAVKVYLSSSAPSGELVALSARSVVHTCPSP